MLSALFSSREPNDKILFDEIPGNDHQKSHQYFKNGILSAFPRFTHHDRELTEEEAGRYSNYSKDTSETGSISEESINQHDPDLIIQAMASQQQWDINIPEQTHIDSSWMYKENDDEIAAASLARIEEGLRNLPENIFPTNSLAPMDIPSTQSLPFNPEDLPDITPFIDPDFLAQLPVDFAHDSQITR